MMRTICWNVLVAAAGFVVLAAAAARCDDVLDERFGVKKIVGECRFTEGPVVDAAGNLFFSDGPNDRIVRRTADGTVSDFRKPCGRTNGMALDLEGRLLMCQSAGPGGGRRVARLEKTGDETPLAVEFNGKPFNAPNDLCVDRRGRIYFTDPNFGKPEEAVQPVSGVYRIDGPGKVSLVIENLQRPNGIALSPDGTLLYVSDRGTQKLHRYRTREDGSVQPDGIAYDFSPDRGIDGMRLDVEGNIYGAAGQGATTGLFVINPQGKLLLHKPMPEFSTNLVFGGPDGKDIFFTASKSVYQLRSQRAGAPLPPIDKQPIGQKPNDKKPIEKHPNILFIMADDIGYGDLSCQGAKHAKTPNLDRIAAQGCRFTDAHSPASTCTPTRRAFLTGTYSWRQQAGSSIAPGDAPLSIPPDNATVASLLKSAGYKTGVVGKWHVGLGPEGGPTWNGEIKPGPRELGFDYSYIMAATGDRVPTVYVENSRVVGLDPNDPIRVSYKEKIGDDPTGRENPELLKLKHTHGHDMTIVNGVGRIGWMTGGKAARWVDEDMSDQFTKHAVRFIETHRAEPFFLFFATHGIHVPRVPHPRFKGTSPVGTRGDAIHELDDAVGTLLATLDRLQLTDNTLVIFTSDNGGVMDDGYEDVGSFDYHPNAPLRGAKGTLYEGGHRVPFLVRFPGHVRPGTTSAALLAHLDMPATFATLAGVDVPRGQCVDSVNVLPALLGQSATGRADFVAHVGGTKGPFALRAGDWKYIAPGASAGRNAKSGTKAKTIATPQLFHLKDDLAEQHNLADSQPAKLMEMTALLERIRQADR